jgi:hypothetical protein
MFSKIVVLYEIYSKKSFCPNTFDQRLYIIIEEFVFEIKKLHGLVRIGYH